ncbi:hypothetical protein ACFL3E_00515 [Patescibacteria group bacterium]
MPLWKKVTLLILVCAVVFVWQEVFQVGSNDELEVYFLYVGQGDAILTLVTQHAN